ncbi:MAG: hypothetical protein CVU05_00755 [Bacteroidetes bacterium HGW-Bacteroidetes-21]|jgi:hypothetical protein|nr:MAG: hypothetical protein CVU05_00755 [Bacteroidetes bacterium HGW-Bacteroidetes-21]
MEKAFLYKAFGLVFSSSIELPELLVVNNESPDVSISIHAVPEAIENPILKTSRFEVAEGRFLLTVDKVARFYAEEGRIVFIMPFPGATEDEIRLFLYGSVFAALFHQRGMMPLHATTVGDGENAYSFSGNSGMGKSSLSFSLIETGRFNLVSDDISILSVNAGNIMALPGLPRVKLWADVLEYTQKDVSQLRNIRKSIEKYNYPLEDRFAKEPVQLKAIFFLTTRHQSEISLKVVTGTEKFNLLQHNIFRLQFMPGNSLQQQYFQFTTAILQKTAVFQVVRPRLGFELGMLRDRIEEAIHSLKKQ